MTNNIRFTTGSLHFIERPQFFSISFQLCLYFSPFETFMAVHVFLKTGFQCSESFFTLFCFHVFCSLHLCPCLSALFHWPLLARPSFGLFFRFTTAANMNPLLTDEEFNYIG